MVAVCLTPNHVWSSHTLYQLFFSQPRFMSEVTNRSTVLSATNYSVSWSSRRPDSCRSHHTFYQLDFSHKVHKDV
jgi:hypothetical protein